MVPNRSHLADRLGASGATEDGSVTVVVVGALDARRRSGSDADGALPAGRGVGGSQPSSIATGAGYARGLVKRCFVPGNRSG